MPPRGRSRTSRSSSTSRARTRSRSSAARNRARAASRARSRAAAAKRRDAARPSVRRSRAASTARSSRSGARTGSRTGGTSAAARRRDAARPSVRRAAAASAARSSRSAARTGSRTGGTSAAARRRDAARPSVVRSRATSAAARRRDANRPSVRNARAAAASRMMSANQTPARTSTASLSERRNAASAKLARQRAQTLAADRRRRQRQATGQANQRAGMYKNIRSGRGGSNKTSPSTAAANQQAAQSLLSAGYRNLAGDKNRSTLGQQFMSGIRNLMRGETLSGTAAPPPRRRSSCPTPDMRILMADGSLKVAGDLQVGDTVRAAHEDTLEWGDHKVTHKEIVEDEIVSLKFENSSIKCSPTHKVYLSNDSKWVEVQDLKEGDVVKTQDGDDTFISLEKIDSGDVIVLTVEDAHTYVAEGILSHNKSPRRKGGGEDDSFTDDSFTDEIIEDEVIEEELPILPVRPQFPNMGGGLGGFGYSPALMAYESQQGAGQVPYYMAAARNAMTPNMSPAFMHAARNYDILGGSQRTRARPIEMMSARERAEIMNMGSNFNVPNYNSPYNQFDYFKNMVSGGGSGGKGGGRPMPQMAGGLGAFMGGMGGMF